MKEIIEKLNNLKIIQKSMDFCEDLPEDVYETYFQKCVNVGLNVDKSRWYEASIDVYKIPEGFLGVKSVTDTFSESTEVKDIFHTLEFFEMEEIQIVTYKKL